MASSPSSSTWEPAIVEQVITEFFAKSVHIILESRSPYVSSRNYSADPFISSLSSSSSSLSFRPRDKWFNLALRDCPAALENFDLWRQSNLEPVVVDVILIHRKSVPETGCPSPCGFLLRNLSSGCDEFGRGNRCDKIVERWIVQYESRSSSCSGKEPSHRARKGNRGSSHSSEFQVMYKKVYRRIIVMLRSLYAAVRLLPAYKLFRDLNASGQIHPLSLSHRISSFAEPFGREEDTEMSQLGFGPLDTFFGRLSLSVSYLKTIEDLSSEPSTPLSTQFIMDYVGSPLASPLKRFQSLPFAGSTPSYGSFTRHHSWSTDHGETASFTPTPSSTYSDPRSVDRNLNPPLPPRSHLPENYTSTCTIQQDSPASYARHFDEFRASPPFSPLSSPSTPSHLYPALLCSESAPVSIPIHKQRENSGGENQQSPSPHSKIRRHGCPSQSDSLRTQPNTPSTYSENKLHLKKELLRFMEHQTCLPLPKTFSSGKDDTGSVMCSKGPSYTSSQIPSRSSSKLSFRDEFDYSDFSCPFAEDDHDVADPCRDESSYDKDYGLNQGTGELITVRRSPDAAVGALVRMLRTAPPLRLDNSDMLRCMHILKDEIPSHDVLMDKMENNNENDVRIVDSSSDLDITASDFLKSRTAAHALAELRNYKEMRECILKQGGSQMEEVVEHASKLDPEDSTEG
ncbi:hypothetical protein AXF42_Ash011431 [Apostasia shenzhenica]|uniref:Autophagy-related protein 13 N-terminal domain-containing protein n=1 Tax=Apostasia shenzhenica TaxID=1088818 RepID=A0A2I0AEG8_9ASPA|nr:hypothetical protein AXF42_Ash011431 [Apostasia shenzhenica]